jgi:hemoglobin
MTQLPDIQNRDDLHTIVVSFYERAKADPVIGWIFTEAFEVNWEKHIPLMVEFWESVLFGTAIYRGNPVQKHIEVDRKVPLTEAHFDRWITLFHQTVDAHFHGERAIDMKTRAAVMRVLIWTKIEASHSPGFIQ